jgi:hypothetical protein
MGCELTTENHAQQDQTNRNDVVVWSIAQRLQATSQGKSIAADFAWGTGSFRNNMGTTAERLGDGLWNTGERER